MLGSLTRDFGIHTLAAETSRDGQALDSHDLLKDVCIVVGGEDKGIREKVLRSCSAIAEIPMNKGVDSLNVANAAAICLYEVQRQRQRRE
jgi:tRNA G18 (ribose-2'-O)-methylase SpoU